jgi:WD40 repeat protein
VIARFEAERQALALMDHPNIARVFDAGTTDSHRPYFVMELVRGVPITDYCDQAQLTPRERLHLFVQVCQAVQHAHQKGVIHRDLKPSNILVTQHDGVPVPKVIDFGVAKAVGQQLTDKTIYTRFAQMIGTPLYMSPEQAEMSGLDLDTRSDIFALGVLLYELLTGTTPFDGERLRKAAFDEVRRIIREEEPPRPSTRLSTLGATLSAVSSRRKTEPGKLSALVRGDLDWIVMKALDKDRTRRYETAHGLAQDVQRYLHDEPVQAGPPSAVYRLRKFVRRNRGPVLAATGVLLALLAGIAGIGWGLVEARQQRDAEQAARKQALAERDAKDDALTQVEGERNAKTAALTRMEQERNAKDAALTDVKAERDARKMDLLRAEGLRLAAQSELVRPKDPALALLLAVEGGRRYTGVLSDGALRSALEACREERTLARHGPVYCAAFSPDGRRVLTCSDDRTARVWDVGTGREVGRLQGLEGPALFGAFSPDGRRLVTVSTTRLPGGHMAYGLKHVRTHDAATLQPLAHWSEPDDRTTQLDRICAVSLSPDGQRVACTFGRYPDWTPRVYETDTGKELLTLSGHDSLVTGMAFSPDGKRIVTTSLDHGTRIWDTADGKLLRRLDEKEMQPGLIVFSADSRRVVTISEGWASEMARDGNRIYRKFKDQFPPWHGQAAELTAGRIWEVESGKELAELRWPKGSGALIRTADFSRDGKWVVMAGNGDTRDDSNSASSSGAGTYPCLWDAIDGKFLTSLKPADTSLKPAELIHGTRAVAFSPTARAQGFLPLVLAAGEDGVDGVAHLWDVRGYQQADNSFTVNFVREISMRGHAGLIHAGAFSADGERVVTAGNDGTARIWDATVGTESGPKKGRWETSGTAVWSPDGGRVLIGGFAPGDLAVYQNVGGPGGGYVLVGGFAPGRQVAAGLWDTTTQTKVVSLPGHESWVQAAGFSRDGKRLITGDFRGTVYLWDAVTGTRLHTLIGHRHQVVRAAISADGSRAVTAGADGGGDDEVFLWDTGTGTRVTALDISKRAFRVMGVAFSPDGGRLALACVPQAERVKSQYHLLLFDAATGKRLWQAEHNGAWGAPCFSPDGKHVLTCCVSEISLWDSATGKVVRSLSAPADFYSDAAFSPNGKRIVTAALNKTARIWDTATGKELVALVGHEGWIGSAAFSPDGSLVVTVATDKSDRTCRLWDARSGKQVGTLKDENHVARAVFSPDGRHVLTYCPGGAARIWPVDPLPVAVKRLPRDFTDQERRYFEIGEEGGAR